MDLGNISNVKELYEKILGETKKASLNGKDTFIENTFLITVEQEKELSKYLGMAKAHPLLTPYGWADLYGEFR